MTATTAENFRLVALSLQEQGPDEYSFEYYVHLTMAAFVAESPRYDYMSHNGEIDYDALVCHDCSTRTTSVVIPAWYLAEHEDDHR